MRRAGGGKSVLNRVGRKSLLRKSISATISGGGKNKLCVRMVQTENSSCKSCVPKACFENLILAKIVRTDCRPARVQAERSVKKLKYSR